MTSVLADDRLFEVELSEAEARPPAAPAGESKTFRRYDQSQQFLVPPSLDDWLDEDDEARFVSEVVENLLDLSPVYRSYESASGAPPYDPRMMLKLLVFAYATGVTSSREVERRCKRDIAFRWLAANEAPDYRSLARFRRRHLDALAPLFLQVLGLCAKAGLVRLGRVALDGTKLDANASRHKAMSYDHVCPKIDELQAEVDAMLAEAEAAGEPEDEVTAAGSVAAKKAKPKPSAQRSFTDPEARMMKTNHGFDYAYNAQAVVDETHQVVLAAEVTQDATDIHQLVPMVEKAAENLEAARISGSPKTMLVDAGYCSEDNLEAAEDLIPDLLAATGRQRHGEKFQKTPRGPIPKGATRREKMARRLRTKKGRADYARRKVIVEPAFGQVKVRQHAGKLRLRGLAGAQGEWTLHMLCHNLRKLRNAGGTATLALA